MLGCENIRVFIQEILKDLSNKENSQFKFHVFRLPLVKICASGCYNYVELHPEDFHYINIPTIQKFLLIHLIPQGDSLYLLLGHIKDSTDQRVLDYVKSWENICGDKFEFQLMNLICSKMEEWCISPLIYQRMDESVLKKFNSFLVEMAKKMDERILITFNFFENHNYGYKEMN